MTKDIITKFMNKIKKNKFAIIIIFSILIIFLIDKFLKKGEILTEALSRDKIISDKSKKLGEKYSKTFTTAMKI